MQSLVEAHRNVGSGSALRRRLRWVAAAAAYWAGIVLLATTYAVLRRDYEYRLSNLVSDVPLVSIGTIASLALVAGLRRLVRLPFQVQVVCAAALVLLAAFVYELLWELALTIIPRPTPFVPSLKFIILGSLFWLAPMGLWAAGHLALFHYAEARHRERRLAALQIEAHEAQVRALRYQVNPHFLYNTLNSIAALILDRRNDEAERMVLRLADFFRSSLARDPLQDSTLAEEIAFQRRYLEVEQLRFENRLDVAIDLPPELERACVPSLILQPLVENALKHGATAGDEALKLRITAVRFDGGVIIDVLNNGVTSTSVSSGTGTGLRNVAHRLTTRFGESATVDTEASGSGFLVRLSFPYEEKQ